MVISVCNSKGGTGKTTSAIAIAEVCARGGISTHLLDLDKQGSATAWVEASKATGNPLSFAASQLPQETRPGSIARKALAQAEGARLLIIDTGPGEIDRMDAAIEMAEQSSGVVLIPSGATHLDIPRTVDTLRSIVDGRGDPHVLLTRTRAGTTLRDGMRATLEAAGATVLKSEIPLRESIARAPGQPLGQAADLITTHQEAATELLSLLSRRSAP